MNRFRKLLDDAGRRMPPPAWQAGRCLAAAGLLAAVLAATAAATPQDRQTQSGSIYVAAKAIPLPPGEWAVAVEFVEPSSDVKAGGLGYRHLMMVREVAGRIVGLVEIRAREPTPNLQENLFAPTSRACRADAPDPVPAIHELAGLPVFRCRRILFGLLPSLGEHGPRQMAALRDRLRDDWHGAPPSLLQVAISIGDMRGVEQLTYGFAPEQCGATKDEQVAHARHWADLVLPMVSRGFDHGAREGAPACR